MTSFPRQLGTGLLIIVTTIAGRNPVAADEGPILTVTATTGEIKVTENGVSRVLGNVPKGTRLWALESRDSFYRVIEPVTKETGWIWSQHVEAFEASPDAAAEQQAAQIAATELDEFLYDNDRRPELIAARQRFLKACLNAYGEAAPVTGVAYYDLGDAWYAAGEYDKATQSLLDSLRVFDRLRGPDCRDAGNACNYLTITMIAQGKYSDARPYAQRCLDIFRKEGLENDIFSANVVNRLGFIFDMLGETDQAEQQYRSAVAIMDQIDELHADDRLTMTTNLTTIYSNSERYDEAERLLSNVLDRLTKAGQEARHRLPDALNELGVVNHSNGQFELAESRFRQALKVQNEMEDTDAAVHLQIHENLASSLIAGSKTDEGIALYRDCIRMRQQQDGVDSLSTANTMNLLGVALHDNARYEEAEQQYQSAIRIYEANVEATDENLLQIRENLITLLDASGKKIEYIERLRDILKIRRSASQPNQTAIATTMDSLALALRNERQFEESVSLYQDVIRIRTEQLGPEHNDTLTAQTSLAFLYEEMAQFNKGEPLLKKVLEMRQQKDGEESAAAANALYDFGHLRFLQGNYREAKQFYDTAISIDNTLNRPDSIQTVELKTNYGILLERLGLYDDAEQILQQALSLSRREFGNQNLETAVSMDALASLYLSIGDYERADDLWNKVLTTRKGILGDDHLLVADAYNALGLLNDEQKEFETAAEYHEQAWNIRNRIAGATSNEVGISLHNMAWAKYQLGKVEEADSLATQSLAISRNLTGEDSEDAAVTLRFIGELRTAQKRYDEAETALNDALKTYRRIYPATHPRIASAQSALAALSVLRNDVFAAVDAQDEASQSARRHLCHVLPGLSDHSRLKYLSEQHSVDLERALSLGLTFRDNPRATIFSAGWLLNGKSAGTEAVAEAALLSVPGSG